MQMLRRIYTFLVLALWCGCAAFSQAVNGTVVGTVTDSSGGVVPGARVTLTEINTLILHAGVTNSTGNYSFPELPPGTYDIAVEMTGFKKETRTGVVLEANTSPRVDLKMQPGEVTQSVVIAANAAGLQTERADTGRTLDEKLVEELPLGVNRNFQSLLDLVPGTAPATFRSSQFFNAAGSLQAEVNGQPLLGNNYQIEGIDNNERSGALQILITPAEAIQSVNVSTSNHDPELGRSTGAVTNVMIKSGTNQYHGAAYEFLQNSAFDARSFFNPSVGHLAYNYVGGNLGGPIRHNKLFFFANYLRTMDHEANTNLESIPDDAFRTGNLSGDPGHQVYDPLTGPQDGSGQGRTPFAGNIIPTSRINPIAAKILSYLPPTNENFVATSQANDYFALLPAIKTNDQSDSKLDWNLTDKDRISGRFSFARPVMYQSSIFGDAGGPAQGAFEGTGRQKTYSSGINYNRIVSPTLLTEIRIGVAHYHNDAYETDYGKNDSAAIGVPGVNISNFTSGFVGIAITDYSSPLVGYSVSLPWDRAEANIDLVNSWTKILRNHQMKWGVDLRRVRDDLLQNQSYSPRGQMSFGAAQTTLVTCTTATSCTTKSNGLANDFASFLLDQPNQVTREVDAYFPAFREWWIFSYIGDNWQVSPKLTVNLGLRWEIYTPPTPHFPGGFSNYDASNNTLVIAGVGQNPLNGGEQTQYKYFAPRLGIAYRLTDKTVIRTGYGVSYTPFPDATWMYNYPIRTNNSYVPPSGADSYGPAVLPGGQLASFEAGFPIPAPIPVPSNGIITNPSPTTAEFAIPLNYKNGYNEAWNFAVQRQLPFGLTLDVAYVGSHGVDTLSRTDLNAGDIIGAGTAGQPFYAKYGITASVSELFQGLSSTYHSLQVKLDRRLAKGLTVTTAFTWQKAMSFQRSDDGGLDFYAGQGLARNYARADYDRTLNFIQSYVYKLPFGPGEHMLSRNLAGKILGGWQLSGIVSARTGTPLIFTGNNSLNLGADGTTTLEQVAPIQTLGGINTGNPWFSTSSFIKTATNVQGNTGLSIWSGPGLFALNGSLSRWIDLRAREGGNIKLQLRLETLNLTNTPQFASPNTSYGSNFGFVTSTISSGTGVNGTGGGRVVQLGAKVTF